MQPLSLLPANPSTHWDSEAPPDLPAGLWQRLAYAPTSRALLYAYIDRTVRRFRDRIKVWEFLNEPLWVPDFCLPQSGGYKISDYLSLLQGAIPPGIKIPISRPPGHRLLRRGLGPAPVIPPGIKIPISY
jgi:hypothetical protein